jgi:hypothetical protein
LFGSEKKHFQELKKKTSEFIFTLFEHSLHLDQSSNEGLKFGWLVKFEIMQLMLEHVAGISEETWNFLSFDEPLHGGRRLLQVVEEQVGDESIQLLIERKTFWNIFTKLGVKVRYFGRGKKIGRTVQLLNTNTNQMWDFVFQTNIPERYPRKLFISSLCAEVPRQDVLKKQRAVQFQESILVLFWQSLKWPY